MGGYRDPRVPAVKAKTLIDRKQLQEEDILRPAFVMIDERTPESNAEDTKLY
jgi:hypothetical protein